MKTFRRHMFHHEGVTDLHKMREEAAAAARAGEPVLLHLHPYIEAYDGCPFNERQRTLELWDEGHEEFVPEGVVA